MIAAAGLSGPYLAIKMVKMVEAPGRRSFAHQSSKDVQDAARRNSNPCYTKTLTRRWRAISVFIA